VPEQRVLVVGAGPVGLVLACELLRRGIDVRVVDKRTQSPAHSRAAILWPRQLELLRRTGVTAPLLDRGHRVDAVAFWSEGRRKGTVRIGALPDALYPFALTISQTVTEEVLAARVVELGGTVEAGTELLTLSHPDAPPGAGDAGPHVSLRGPEGEVTYERFDWVIGADGAHSAVRRLLDVPFAAAPANIAFGICDAPVEGAPSDRTMHYYWSGAGAIGLAPLRAGVFRIAMSLPSADDGPPPRELFQRLLDERAPRSGTVGEPEWTASFAVRFGTAQAFRRGRCFLVGDAAHIMSPAGGQGMNTGVQDAVNLGWKLAAVVHREAPDALLDTYETERRAAAVRVTTTTGVQTKLGLVKTPWRRRARDAGLVVADRTGVLQRVAAPVLTQLDTSYAPEPAPLLRRGPLRVGDRVPAFVPDGAAWPGAVAWPVLDADRWTLALWPGRSAGALDPARVERLTAALPGVHVTGLAAPGSPALRRRLGGSPRFLLVRPDGHLAASGALDPGDKGVLGAVRAVAPAAPVAAGPRT
jgi:2-polyprenyl-6-methoxyphenol hydroxylase-like FAD-dependent oxidoreductase